MYDNYLEIVQARLSIPAAVSVEIENIVFEDDHLKALIHMESGSPIESDQIALVAILAESHIPESWQNLDELNFVERGIYGGADGASVDLSDQMDSKVINIPLDEAWEMDNSELVVFVQNLETKEIYNGNKIDLLMVSTKEVNQWVSIYPNPASDYISINNAGAAEATLYNMQGQPVLNTMLRNQNERIDVSGLGFGVYMLELKIEGEKFNKKILINR